MHLPWCVKKCPYCDFNSHIQPQDAHSEQDYVQALLRDLAFESQRMEQRSIETIFFGGGTPSLFSVESIEIILDGIHRFFEVASEVEITLEANPGAVDAQKFLGLRQVGVNRLSIGVQSFCNHKLKALGRIHDCDEAIAAIEFARAAGFENINIDLMYGLPEQSVEQAKDDLEQAIAFEPSHISWYELTLEPNTVFYSKPPALPDCDSAWQMQTTGQAVLADNDYTQYEVSAYGKTQCRHNLNYWQFADYIGIGAGAHGKITDANHESINRFVRHKLPRSYIQYAGGESAITEQRQVETQDLIFEFMLNALRLKQGFGLELFKQRTGLNFESIAQALHRAIDQGYLNRQVDHIKPTNRGRRYLNNVIELFLP